MGIISYIKIAREFKKLLKEMKEQEKHYLSMSLEDLETLTDEALYEAISARINNEIGNRDVEECLGYLQGAKRTFYILEYFDMEIQNGGLCQFFVNSSRALAPYVILNLEEVGADEYAKLYAEFIIDNEIDKVDLNSFAIYDEEEYEQQTKRYPFDDFDDVFYKMYEENPLNTMVVKYVRDHLKDF